MDELEKLNAKLKIANTGIKIVQRGAKLSLVGMLPRKDGTGKAQQRIALDIYANPAGLKRAYAEAIKLSSLLALKEFDWSLYRPETEKPKTVGEWVARFESEYFNRRARTPQSEMTWSCHYHAFFKRMAPDLPLTANLLKQTIFLSNPDTRTRQMYCLAANALAKFTGIEFNASPYSGSYSPKLVTPRELPSDEQIIEWRERWTDPQWQYVFGLMACYGLRNHEVFYLDLESLKTSPGILTVIGGKTGKRRVWPCHAHWWDEWHLWDSSLMPTVAEARNNHLWGAKITRRFKREGIDQPYNLRHAWAVRTLEIGLDVSLAAAQMGHSLKIHCDVYHHWISDRTHQKAFDEILAMGKKKIKDVSP